MKKNRKQEIARYRSGLAAKALAASLLLAAASGRRWGRRPSTI